MLAIYQPVNLPILGDGVSTSIVVSLTTVLPQLTVRGALHVATVVQWSGDVGITNVAVDSHAETVSITFDAPMTQGNPVTGEGLYSLTLGLGILPS